MDCKISPHGKQFLTFHDGNYSLDISDIVRGHKIKFFSYGGKFHPSFNVEGTLILTQNDNTLTAQDVTTGEFTDLIQAGHNLIGLEASPNPHGKQIAVLRDKNTLAFVNTLNIYGPSTAQTLGTNDKALNLKGTIASCSMGLSNPDIMIFQKKGDYIFPEEIIKCLFPQDSNHAVKVREISLVAERLTPIHGRIVGSDLQWINLQKLDLSRNKISDEGAESIAKNKTWINLEEMVLRNTELSDKSAEMIAANDTWKNLKKLNLSSNKISDAGAEAIGKNSFWINLKELIL